MIKKVAMYVERMEANVGKMKQSWRKGDGGQRRRG